MKTSSIKLGSSTNLTNGYNPAWLTGKVTESGLFATVKKPLEEKDLILPTQKGKWNYPVITLHDTAYSLLHALYPARIVNPSGNTAEAQFNAGELFSGSTTEKDAFDKFKISSGIDLSIKDVGYALVKITRNDATITHTSAQHGILIHAHPQMPNTDLGVSEEFRQALIRLRPCLDYANSFCQGLLSVDIVNEYLDFFRTYGTHYVSAADVGDVIFQIFSYTKPNFERVKAGFTAASLTEEASHEFAYYTTSLKKGKYGYASESSNIMAFSDDAALKQSLQAKQWFEPIYAQGDSIFAMFNNGSEVERSKLDTKFKETAPIAFNLSTLTIFAEAQRRLAWSRIYSGALVQKFPLFSQPNLKPQYETKVEKLFGGISYSGLASTLATPNMNIYKPSIDPTQLKFNGTDIVQNFTVTTNLLKLYQSTNFTLPGKNILITAQVVAAETSEKAVTVTITNKNDQQENILYCNKFYGLLRFVFAKTNKSYTILDGIRLVTLEADTATAKKGDTKAEGDIRTAPPLTALPKLKQDLQFSYTFLQTSLHNNLVQKELSFESFLDNGLKWIVKQIPVDTTDKDLLNIRVMCTDIINNSKSDKKGAYVPILPADAYKEKFVDILDLLVTLDSDFKHAEEKIALRKTQELIIDVGKTLNDNIKASGSALMEYIKAGASSQKEMAGYYDAIATDQEAQYQQMNMNVELLKSRVDAQQRTVNYAISDYKEKVKSWATMKAISTSFTLISDVFSAAGAATDAIKEVDKLKQLIIKIKKVITLLAALGKAYKAAEGSVKEIIDANAALETIDKAGTLMLSQLEWDELQINITTILNEGPDEDAAGEAKEQVLAEFKILVLRGKALLDAQINANKLAREIFNNQKLKEILLQQQENLNKINAQFTEVDTSKMDLSTIDLAGLTGNLDVLQNQMLSMLANTYTLQDQALQYEFLQPSTPVNDFTLVGFKTARIHQKAATLEAITKQKDCQANETTEIGYIIKSIPVDQITKGNVFNIAIGLDAKEFLHYVNARVVAVVASSKTRITTTSGKFYFRLKCVADPFMDRDTDRKVVTYHTLAREKSYEYKCEDMTPLFDDKGKTWSEGVNPVTPFTVWELSFPDTSLNAGISFGGATVDIALGFKLKARIKDVPKLFSSLGTQPTAIELVKEMAAVGPVTNGWDVVYNMSLTKINESLNKQFIALAATASYFKIKCKVQTAEMAPVKMFTSFDIDMGYPDLQFVSNNQTNASLKFKLSGSITKSMIIENQPEKFEPPKILTIETLKADIPISMVVGMVTPSVPGSKVYSVILEVAKGAFTSNEIDLSDEGQRNLNIILKDHFVNNPVKFLISSIDLSQIAVLDDLRPNEFLFKTLVTPANIKILQIFIETNNRKALNVSQAFLNNLPEPLPVGSSASLLIGSKLFFNEILPKSIKGGWTLGGKASEGLKPWSSKILTGKVSGFVDTSGMRRAITDGDAIIYINPDRSNTIDVEVQGMTIAPTNSGILKLDFSKIKTVTFYDHKEWLNCNPYTGHCSPKSTTDQYNTDVNIGISALLPVSITGSGRNQSVQISVSNKEVNVDGKMSGGGPCGCADMEAQLNVAIKNQIPAQITGVTNISFDSLSVFALKNLLFPTDNFINLKAVHVPGDMLILGEFSASA